MKPSTKQENFVRKCAGHCRDLLLLNSYGLTWDFCGNEHEKANVLAEIQADNVYKEINVSVFPKFWQETEYSQFTVILHEFCHVFTAHQKLLLNVIVDDGIVTRREIDQKNEHETALIEKSFIWLLNGPEKYKEISQFIRKLSTRKTHK